MESNSNAENQKDPCLMKAHFLKPFVTSIDGPVAEFPRTSHSVSSLDLKEAFSRISFTGFWFQNGNFRSWSEKMEALHEPIWRKVGIFEAIKASSYKILEDQSLIQALVQKWCPQTKTFVFPWGEATVTLEDVMVLLGFSVLGSPVLAPLESSEMRDSIKKLEKARAKVISKDGCVNQLQWTLSFRDRDDSLEHEAFLAMWLSHLVFPQKSRRSISKHVFPVAVRLARGERIALAPPVLASIYRDLGQIQAFARDKSTQNLIIKSLFKLVQVWGWERFKNIRPEAREIQKGEPRVAQWSFLKERDEKDESLSFDDFNWRPYTKPLRNWDPPRFYVEEAKWVTVDDNLDDEFVSFARCLRSSQLVGIGFVEGYYPNRVAMQFGLAQDLPGLVTLHSDFTEKDAWDDYNKSLDGLKLYMPSRLARISVTARYRDWWLKSVSEFLGSSESTETFNARNTADHYDNDGGLSPKLGEGFAAKLRRCRKRRVGKQAWSEIKKDKIGDCGASASTEVPLSVLFKKELAKMKGKHLRNKRRRVEETGGAESESLGKRSRLGEDNNDSGIYEKLVSGDEETGSKAEKITPSYENNSLEPAIGSNGGVVVDTVVSPPETRQNCGCDDDFDVNDINAKKKNMVDDGTNEADCLVHEYTEKQTFHEKKDDDERLKQRKLAINELAFEKDNNDSGIIQMLASEDDETVKPQEIEQMSEDIDEETGSKAEKITVLTPSYENNSSEPPTGSYGGGLVDIVVPPPETRQNSGFDDELDVNDTNAERNNMVDDGTKEAECLVHECSEKQRSNEKKDDEDDDDDERLKQKKLALNEIALNLEARIMKVEKTLAKIKEWKTNKALAN